MEGGGVMKPRQSFADWLWSWWIPMSPSILKEAEKKILSFVPGTYRGFYVDVGSVVGNSDKIWTISLNADSENIPILMLHGLGSGVALWCLNVACLASNNPVYAIDLMGFGRSSRPKFSSDAVKAEDQFVSSIEQWRKQMNIPKFVVLGHSMGAFIAASYGIKHPERTSHIILADPWGFADKPSDSLTKFKLPLWAQALAYVIRPLNPLFALRAAGPFGQWLIEKVRPDLSRKFTPLLKNDANIILQYLYQCNAQTPTGEAAFRCMASVGGCAKNPMLRRIKNIDKNVPITLIYGSRSWVDNSGTEEIWNERKKTSYVNIQVLSGAGHHVYADKYEIFNKLVLEACRYSESQI